VAPFPGAGGAFLGNRGQYPMNGSFLGAGKIAAEAPSAAEYRLPHRNIESPLYALSEVHL